MSFPNSVTPVFNKAFLDVSFDNTLIENITEETLFGREIYEKRLIRNSALWGISKLATPNQRKKKERILSLLLKWIFISKSCNKSIDRIQERLLWLIPNDYESSFNIFSIKQLTNYLNGLFSNLMNKVLLLTQKPL